MARKTTTVTTVTDDLTGETLDADTRPTEFSYGGKTYSIDLGPDSVRRLEEALKPFIDAAQVVTGRGRRGSRGASSRGSGTQASVIRAWAIERGLDRKSVV